ncbi:MAG: nucleoside monophosphate kinase [Candidatus Aenigmarchaeota archaeon]|nr:nucleoside monophosphate kinase [Candidatus Aenigmarchaeota archaeon]
MIITISGKPGSGKSTVARLLAKRLGYRHYSVGDFMRQIAKEKKISLLELSNIAEQGIETDSRLDDMQIKLKGQDNFVLDSRLGWHFLPNSLKIFLEVDDKTAAKRIYRDMRKEEKENMTLEDTEKSIRRRIKSEKERYKEYYGLNPYDKRHYDLVMDTNRQAPEKVVRIILNFLEGQLPHHP